jgi:hypothetical protein
VFPLELVVPASLAEPDPLLPELVLPELEPTVLPEDDPADPDESASLSGTETFDVSAQPAIARSADATSAQTEGAIREADEDRGRLM